MEQKQWEILGLAPTKEEKKIRAAYYARLAENNPEDKPEEFKALRAAYEAALEWAKASEGAATGEAKEKTPYEIWQGQIKALYADLPARCSPARWQALLDEPFCQSPASRLAAKDGLLRVLMEHCFLPQRIWQLLDDFFDFHGTKQELYELYPKNFVDYGVLNSVDYPESIPVDEFTDTTGEAADEYISTANRLRHQLRTGNKEQAAQLLQKLESIPAHHSHTLLVKAQVAHLQDDDAAAMEFCTAYLVQCPENTNGLLLKAQLLLAQNDNEGALEVVDKALAVDGNLNQAKYDRICILEAKGELARAKEELMELHREQPRNHILQEKAEELNKALLPQLAAKHEQAPEDAPLALDLAWCYFQLEDEKKAEAVMEPYGEKLAGEYEYENFVGKLLLNGDHFAEALIHLRRWEKSMRDLEAEGQSPADLAQGGLGEAEKARRLKRLPEAVHLQAFCLFHLGQKDEAFALLQKCESEFPEDSETYLAHAQLLAADDRTEETEPLFERIIQLAPGDGYIRYLRGVYRFRRGEKLPAWQELQAAMEAYGKELHCMALQCRILMDDDHWEEAEKMLEEMKNIPDSENIDLAFCLARQAERFFQAAETADNKNDKKVEELKQKTQECYVRVLERLRGGETMEREGDVFFCYAIFREGDAEYSELAELLEEGLRYRPGDVRLQDFRAFCLIKMKAYQEATKVYEAMEEKYPANPVPTEKIAEIYRVNLRDFPRAAAQYQKLLSMRETAEIHARYGKCLQEIGQYPQAEEQLLAALKLDPEQPAFYANLGGLYATWGKPEQAAEQLRKALEAPNTGAAFYAAVRNQLAHIEFRMGHNEAALALWKQNTEAGELDQLTDMADVEEHAGNYKEALRLLDEWRQRRPEEDEGWYLRHRGELLRGMGRQREAAAMLRQGAMKHTTCLNALAHFYFDKGRYRIAVRLAKKCVDAEPDNFVYSKSLAEFLYFAGNKARAAKQAKHSLQLLEQEKDEYQVALYTTLQAKLLALAGCPEEAKAACEQAQKAPLCSNCNYGHCKDADMAQALLCELAGEYKEAMKHLKRGQKAAPEDLDFEAAMRRLRKRGEKI